MPKEDILFLKTVSPDPRNRLGKDNLPRGGIHRIQIDVINRNTVHECPLHIRTYHFKEYVPHILRGASSSRRIG
jgi:hypothetical protein